VIPAQALRDHEVESFISMRGKYIFPSGIGETTGDDNSAK
jgi:hypothetical protein